MSNFINYYNINRIKSKLKELTLTEYRKLVLN
ncbi:IS3 family transposase [Lactobacillus kullabergensis]